MNKNRNEEIFAILIIVIASVLRIYNYADWSLSNDELSAMARLQFPSFNEMIEKGVRLNDMHPIGVQSFLWFWTHLVGTSVASFRLPFVLFGIGSVIVFYRIAIIWFNRTSALFSLSLFSALQFPILYSQLARPYSPGLFFSLLFVLAWTKIIFENETISIFNISKRKWYFIFILSGLSCMYIHYFSFMFAGIVGLTGLFYLRKEDYKWYLIAGVSMFLFYIPNINVFIFQFNVGGLGGDGGWLGVPERWAIFSYCFYGLNESKLVLGSCLVLLIGSVIYNKQKLIWTKFHSFSVLFFLLPALIAFYYSIFKNPVFQYSILLFSFPFLLLMICSFIPARSWSIKKGLILSCFISIILYSTIIEQKFYSAQNFANFKGVAQRTIELNEKYSSGKIINTMNVISPFYIDYYLSKNALPFKIESYRCEHIPDFVLLNNFLKTNTKEYFLHGWANTFHAPEIDQIVQQYYPYIIERDSFFNSGLILFSKVKCDGLDFNRKILFEENNSFEKPLWVNDSSCIVSGVAHSGTHATQLTESIEYGSTFSAKIKDVHLIMGNTIQLSCWINTAEVLNGASLVFSINRGENSVVWRSVNLQDFVIKENSWSQVFMAYTIAEDLEQEDDIKVFIWNTTKQKFIADDFLIRVLK